MVGLAIVSLIKDAHLIDYKVRVLESTSGTDAQVRVTISTTDGKTTWGTVGVSTNLIEASWDALVDSIEYKQLSLGLTNEAFKKSTDCMPV